MVALGVLGVAVSLCVSGLLKAEEKSGGGAVGPTPAIAPVHSRADTLDVFEFLRSTDFDKMNPSLTVPLEKEFKKLLSRKAWVDIKFKTAKTQAELRAMGLEVTHVGGPIVVADATIEAVFRASRSPDVISIQGYSGFSDRCTPPKPDPTPTYCVDVLADPQP